MEGKQKMSKTVLQLKFMRRTVLRMEEEQNAEEKQRAIDDEHWVLDLPQLKQREERFFMQPSYTVCENLQFGRMSFGGFNREMEKLMTVNNTEAELQQAEEREKLTEVSATEMADRYSALVGIISNKFMSKKRRREIQEGNPDNESDEDDDNDGLIETPVKAKKSKFMKPADTDG